MGTAKIHTDGMNISHDETVFSSDEFSEQLVSIGARRQAREIALRGLYALELSGNSVHTIIRQIIEEGPVNRRIVREFARKMIELAFDRQYELDGYIKKLAANWDFSRIAVIDRIIMRMAICEFLYFFDIPPKVSIDEAIELTKVYSTEKSGQFVNGILDAVLAELKKANQVIKSGRGLQESSKKKNSKP